MFLFFFTSGAGASVFQVKAERTFTAEGSSSVHTLGPDRAGVVLTLIHIWRHSGDTILYII